MQSMQRAIYNIFQEKLIFILLKNIVNGTSHTLHFHPSIIIVYFLVQVPRVWAKSNDFRELILVTMIDFFREQTMVDEVTTYLVSINRTFFS